MFLITLVYIIRLYYIGIYRVLLLNPAMYYTAGSRYADVKRRENVSSRVHNCVSTNDNG